MTGPSLGPVLVRSPARRFDPIAHASVDCHVIEAAALLARDGAAVLVRWASGTAAWIDAARLVEPPPQP